MAVATTGLTMRHALASGTTVVDDATTLFSRNGSGCGDEIDGLYNPTSATAVADTSRPWAEVRSFSVTTGSYSVSSRAGISNPPFTPAPSVSAAFVTLNLCGPIPQFPTFNGDTGIEWTFNLQSNQYPCNNGPLTGSTDAQVISYGVHGEPIFDGPFPECDGYYFFGFASLTAPFQTLDVGVGWFDPTSNLTFLDTELTTHTATGEIADPGNIYANNSGPYGGVVKFVIPQDWTWLFDAKNGLYARERVFGSAPATLDNLTTRSFTTTALAAGPGTLPTCGTPIACLNGAGGLLTPVDYAPGYQVCDSLGGPIPNPSEWVLAGKSLQCPTSPVNSFDLGATGLSLAVSEGVSVTAQGRSLAYHQHLADQNEDDVENVYLANFGIGGPPEQGEDDEDDENLEPNEAPEPGEDAGSDLAVTVTPGVVSTATTVGAGANATEAPIRPGQGDPGSAFAHLFGTVALDPCAATAWYGAAPGLPPGGHDNGDLAGTSLCPLASLLGPAPYQWYYYDVYGRILTPGTAHFVPNWERVVGP